MVLILYNPPPNNPNKYEGDIREQNLETKSGLSLCVDPRNVFGPCPILKNSQIRAKNFFHFFVFALLASDQG